MEKKKKNLRRNMLRRLKGIQQRADLGDPLVAGDGVGGAAEDRGVVDFDGGAVDFGLEGGEVDGVVVEGLFGFFFFIGFGWLIGRGREGGWLGGGGWMGSGGD